MILRRLYLYLVSAAALTVLAAGLALLGGTILLFVFNDPSSQYSRGQLATFTAMTVVALPVWAIHFGFAQRFAMRDPFERASALRRLYLYWACLVAAIATTQALGVTLTAVLGPPLDGSTFEPLNASQVGWATFVFAAVFAAHFWMAWRDHGAVGEDGASATLRRWYMYVALLTGMLILLANGAYLLQVAWTRLVTTHSTGIQQLMADPAGFALAGGLLWAFHARAISARYVQDDRHSTLRAVEGFLGLAVSIATALVGASQILYYALARILGVDNPGGAGNDVLVAAAGPASLFLVFGVAWFLLQRRLARDAGTQEADRQAGVRRLYTNLTALVSLAAGAAGAGGVLWTLAEQLEAPIIGVQAGDWRDPLSLWLTLLVVGAAVWVAHWRQAPWAADRQSLSRRLYVWAALLGSILAVLAGGVGMINSLLQQAFSAHPALSDRTNLDFGHYLAVVVVAAAVGAYHWRVLRADAAARPPKTAPPAVAAARPPIVAEPAAPVAPSGDTVPANARRYTLVVSDATEDDVHQALAGLPPQASYHLTPAEQPVAGR